VVAACRVSHSLALSAPLSRARRATRGSSELVTLKTLPLLLEPSFERIETLCAATTPRTERIVGMVSPVFGDGMRGPMLTRLVVWLEQSARALVVYASDGATGLAAVHNALGRTNLTAVERERVQIVPWFVSDRSVMRWMCQNLAYWHFQRSLLARNVDWVLVFDTDEIPVSAIAGQTLDRCVAPFVSRSEEECFRRVRPPLTRLAA
jgi:hypothetical protein